MKISCSITQIPDKGPVESNCPSRGMSCHGHFFVVGGFHRRDAKNAKSTQSKCGINFALTLRPLRLCGEKLIATCPTVQDRQPSTLPIKENASAAKATEAQE